MNETSNSSPSELSQWVDNEIGYITLIQAINEEDHPYWYYVSIAPSKYEAFKKAEEEGAYDINDYGEILYHGPGTEPPEDVVKMMQENYGTRDDFEEAFEQAIEDISGFRGDA